MHYNFIIRKYIILFLFINIFNKIYFFISFIYHLTKLNIYNIYTYKYNYNNYADYNYVLNLNKYYKLK